MKQFILATIVIIFTGCRKSDEGFEMKNMDDGFNAEYAFFTAGHTYGNPNNPQLGLHPPFKNKIDWINNYEGMELGVLTGDVVPFPTQTYWDSARADINKFSIPIHIAPGNHDKGEVFSNLYTHYYYFWNKNDLFIILSPTKWNVTGNQKEFLENTLKDNAELAKNVFIFCHELIWWSPSNKFRKVEINYKPYYPGNTNYWSDISPLLESYSNNFYIYAGDLGASNRVTPYFYYNYKNITLIGSGMGNCKSDNIIITEVNEKGETNLKVIGLNREKPFKIMDLRDYVLPFFNHII